MKVIEHEPAFWFLLAKDERLFLDVNCSNGAVSYDMLIELNEDESVRYVADGKNYLNTLAESVNYSASGAESIYNTRNVSSIYGDEVGSAIAFWSNAA